MFCIYLDTQQKSFWWNRWAARRLWCPVLHEQNFIGQGNMNVISDICCVWKIFRWFLSSGSSPSTQLLSCFAVSAWKWLASLSEISSDKIICTMENRSIVICLFGGCFALFISHLWSVIYCNISEGKVKCGSCLSLLFCLYWSCTNLSHRNQCNVEMLSWELLACV